MTAKKNPYQKQEKLQGQYYVFLFNGNEFTYLFICLFIFWHYKFTHEKATLTFL